MSNRRSGLRTKAGQSVAKIREEKKPSAPPAGNSDSYLPALGVYGFGEIEPVILAALVTEDPAAARSVRQARARRTCSTRCPRRSASSTGTITPA